MMEAAYARAIASKRPRRAASLLAAYTDAVVEQASVLLDGLLTTAAVQLGWTAMPSDEELVRMVEAASSEYLLVPQAARAGASAVGEGQQQVSATSVGVQQPGAVVPRDGVAWPW